MQHPSQKFRHDGSHDKEYRASLLKELTGIPRDVENHQSFRNESIDEHVIGETAFGSGPAYSPVRGVENSGNQTAFESQNPISNLLEGKPESQVESNHTMIVKNGVVVLKEQPH